ncbi:hypothetical protein BDZ89DRAFT_1061635 [Hymenopellis radicata]|nr:hypothetical protein BDZ89DRAFT_1061635 [Hymenopellis radicata]
MVSSSPPLIDGFEEPDFEFRNLSSSFFPPIAPDGAIAPPALPLKPLYPSQAGFHGRKLSQNGGPPSPLSEVFPSSLSLESDGSSEGRNTESTSSSSTPTRSGSSKSYTCSPLNPTVVPSAVTVVPRVRRSQSIDIARLPSEDIRAFRKPTLDGSRGGSMILYRLVDVTQPTTTIVAPFRMSHAHRDSVASSSGDSVISLSPDSKYPLFSSSTERGMVAYSFDPLLDDMTDDEDDMFGEDKKPTHISRRRLGNVVALVLLVIGLLSLLVVYPVVAFYRANHRDRRIVDNPYINSTGQAEPTIVANNNNRRSQIPLTFDLHNTVPYINPEMSHLNRPTAGSMIIFSDEFERDGDSLARGQDFVWRISNPTTVSSSFAHIHQGNMIINSSSSPLGVLHIRKPICLSSGFLEISYRLQGQSKTREFFWAHDAQTGAVWLDINIDNLDMGWEAPVVWIDYVRVFQRAHDTSSCSEASYTKTVSFSPSLIHDYSRDSGQH